MSVTMLGALLNGFRLRQYFNAITRTRQWVQGLQQDAGFVTTPPELRCACQPVRHMPGIGSRFPRPSRTSLVSRRGSGSRWRQQAEAAR